MISGHCAPTICMHALALAHAAPTLRGPCSSALCSENVVWCWQGYLGNTLQLIFGKCFMWCLQGYLVDTARLAFDIYVTVQSNASTATQTLHLGPTEPFSITLDAQVAAQLLGDLASYTAMPDFSSYYLMIPTPTGAPAPPAGTSCTSCCESSML